jgi:iron complex transport system substrate-binding protein
MRTLWLALLVAVSAATPSAQGPQRIVSTSPSFTETLFALGLGSRVVAVSEFCRFPPEVAALPTIGTYLNPDVERIAQLRPDLVIIHAKADGLERNLNTLKLRYLAIDPAALESVFTSIRSIGAAAEVGDRASALISSIQGRLDRVRKAVAGRKPQRVLLIVGRRPGMLTDLIAAGPGSYLSDLVRIAGGVNVLSGPKLPEYPRISMETVIRLEPDVIIDAGDMEDRPAERKQRVAATLALWSRQQVAPARNGRVHVVVDDAFVIPGPRVVEAADTMALWLHGVGR